jgi:MFS family permease
MAKPESYKWRVVAMLWFVCFLNYADRQSIFSVFPKLKEEFGFNKVQLGLIGSAFMWVYAGCAPLTGFICAVSPQRPYSRRLSVLELRHGDHGLVSEALAFCRRAGAGRPG